MVVYNRLILEEVKVGGGECVKNDVRFVDVQLVGFCIILKPVLIVACACSRNDYPTLQQDLPHRAIPSHSPSLFFQFFRKYRKILIYRL